MYSIQMEIIFSNMHINILKNVPKNCVPDLCGKAAAFVFAALFRPTRARIHTRFLNRIPHSPQSSPDASENLRVREAIWEPFCHLSQEELSHSVTRVQKSSKN